MTAEKKKLGLISKLIIGIVVGAIIGLTLPEFLVRILVTVSSIFSLFLKFVIPFIILSFVVCGIADLTQGPVQRWGAVSPHVQKPLSWTWPIGPHTARSNSSAHSSARVFLPKT